MSKLHARGATRLRRAFPLTALAVALSLGTACGNDPLEGLYTESGAPEKRDHKHQKPTEKSVKAFYARVSRAARRGDLDQLCKMTQPAHVKAMIKEVNEAGVAVTRCQEIWQIALAHDPWGYQDKIHNIAIKGKTATFRSGDDPWRIRLVHGKWLIVDPR